MASRDSEDPHRGADASDARADELLRNVRLAESPEPDYVTLGWALLRLGDALWEEARDPPRALDLVARSQLAFIAAGPAGFSGDQESRE